MYLMFVSSLLSTLLACRSPGPLGIFVVASHATEAATILVLKQSNIARQRARGRDIPVVREGQGGPQQDMLAALAGFSLEV